MFCLHQYGVFHFVWLESKTYIFPHCRVNCHQFLTVFSCSWIVKARHLLSVTVALRIYFIAFWWCNCIQCQSAWSKSPLRLKSLSSTELDILENTKRRMNYALFPHSKFWTTPLKPRQDKFNSFQMHTETFQLSSWYLKKILNLEQNYCKEWKKFNIPVTL